MAPDPAPERTLPPVSEAGAPFWDASRDQRLVLPWCPSCDAPHWYPRGFCPTCLSEDVAWRGSHGTGVVAAVSVQPKPTERALVDRVPYAVALVDLDDGVRMMLQVVADHPFAVAIDDRVVVGWEALSDGRHLPTAILQP